MGAGVRGLEVVGVVGAGHGGADRPGDPDGGLGDPGLLGEAVGLDLHEVVVPAEHLLVPAGDLPGLVLLAGGQEPRHLRVQAPRQDQEPVRVLGQKLLIYPGLIVEPFKICFGDELDEVLVALPGPHQDRHMVGALVGPVHVGPLEPAPRRHVELGPEERLDSGLFAGQVKVDGPEQVAVVGEGQRGEAELLGPGDELVQLGRAVQEAVLRVDVQVDEVRMGHGASVGRLPLRARGSG